MNVIPRLDRGIQDVFNLNAKDTFFIIFILKAMHMPEQQPIVIKED
jgi:hypothetical protein